MQRGSYELVEYGGKHSGSTSTQYTSDELVLNREDIAYVMKALRRGNASDQAFARKMFSTLCPHTHCDCCNHWLSTAKDDPHIWSDKTLCYKCWFILSDIDYIRQSIKYGCKGSPDDIMKDVRQAREEWCPAKINYLVNERTYARCVKKYKELFGARGWDDIDQHISGARTWYTRQS